VGALCDDAALHVIAAFGYRPVISGRACRRALRGTAASDRGGIPDKLADTVICAYPGVVPFTKQLVLVLLPDRLTPPEQVHVTVALDGTLILRTSCAERLGFAERTRAVTPVT